MSKKHFLLCIVIFLSPFNLAYADVVINEVQLLPTGERFIELYNTGGSSVDLTNWLMQRKTLTAESFSSLVTSSNFEGKSMGANDFFVISRTQIESSDAVVSTLTLTESNTIQIKISGETEIIDKIGWGEVSDCLSPCPPNPAEGQSLQRMSDGSWISAAPTPGIANQTSSAPEEEENEQPGSTGGGSSSPVSSSTENKTKPPEIKKIKVQIVANKLALSGSPLVFRGMAFGHSGEELYSGTYFWNFGDGDSREVKANSKEQFTHTYFYPGEYVVSLEYYMNNHSDAPDAMEKITIKVVGADIVISSVGDEKDFFVELTNNTSYEADISKWILTGNNKSFIFPKNTILGSKKKITFSSRVTRFSVLDKNNLKLLSPQGELAFDYAALSAPPAVVPAVSLPVQSNQSHQEVKTEFIESTEEIIEAPNESISAPHLSAAAIQSDILEENSNTFRKVGVPLAAAILILGSAGAVYFIRQRRTISGAGEDFQILDE